MRLTKEVLRTSAAWAVLAAGMSLSGVAFAQEAAQPETTTAPAPAASPANQQAQTIVVTGSRIRRNEFTSASPIQVITSEISDLRGNVDTAEMLQSSSLAAGSPQNDATISSAFVTEGGPGSQTLSLRGLGANRTLVLLNGRRAGPAGTRGQVSAFDLNVIPRSQVDRVEILKDGASSVYGSDAIAGVANIITRRNLDGGDLRAFVNNPFEEGGREFNLEAVYGKTFDRGGFSVSLDYFKQEELTFGDRDYLSCANQYTFDNTTGARNDLVDARTGRFACRSLLSGHVWLYEYIGGASAGPWASGQPLNSPGGAVKFQFDGSGQLGALVPGTVIPTPPAGQVGLWPQAPANWFLVDYNRATQGVANANPPERLESSLIPEIERATVFATGQYDLTSRIEAYGEVLLNRRETRFNDFRQYWTYLYTQDLGEPFAAGWRGFATLSPTPIIGTNASTKVDYARAVGGLRGSFSGLPNMGDVEWDLVVQASRSDGEYTNDVILDDAVRVSTLRTASCVGTRLPVSGKPCVDINWLDPNFLNGRPNQQARDFLFSKETGKTIYEQIYIEGFVSGDLFKLPAGNVGGVLGFHLRKDEIEDTPGPITLARNVWGASAAGVTQGSDETKEVFLEVGVPLLRGMRFAEDLSFSFSGRYTDVDSYGSDTVYKLGFDWQVTPAWKLRATQGTSFRAPALFELFLANQTSFLGQRAIDPCIGWESRLANGTLPARIANNCRADGIPGDYTGAGASATVRTGGGLGTLEAERSEAFTVGLVWSPGFADLNVALDYVDIDISDQVARLGAANILRACYNSETFPTDPLCRLFTRGQQTNRFLVNTVQDNYINVAQQTNRGLDLTVRYGHEFSFGDLTFQGQFTWQLEDTVSLFAGNLIDTNGDVGDPDFVGNFDITFDRGDWRYFWGANIVGKASEAEDIGDTNAAGTIRYKVFTETTITHDVSVRRRFDRIEVTLGISNVFDDHPPALTTVNLGQYATEGTSVLASQYDYVGRTAFLSVRYRFQQ